MQGEVVVVGFDRLIARLTRDGRQGLFGRVEEPFLSLGVVASLDAVGDGLFIAIQFFCNGHIVGPFLDFRIDLRRTAAAAGQQGRDCRLLAE